MKKALFSLVVIATLLVSTSAFAAYVETISVNSGYQFVSVDWTHTYDGSVSGPFKATLSILADDVDAASDTMPAEIDKVYINGTYIGDLVNYGEFDNNRPAGMPQNLSISVFDITPFLTSSMGIHIDVFNGADSYAVEILESTLTVTPTPIPGAALLLGSGLFGLVGLRRRMKA